MKALTDRVYELAYAWHMDPFSLMERTVDEILELLLQTNRIAQARE